VKLSNLYYTSDDLIEIDESERLEEVTNVKKKKKSKREI